MQESAENRLGPLLHLDPISRHGASWTGMRGFDIMWCKRLFNAAQTNHSADRVRNLSRKAARLLSSFLTLPGIEGRCGRTSENLPFWICWERILKTFLSVHELSTSAAIRGKMLWKGRMWCEIFRRLSRLFLYDPLHFLPCHIHIHLSWADVPPCQTASFTDFWHLTSRFYFCLLYDEFRLLLVLYSHLKRACTHCTLCELFEGFKVCCETLLYAQLLIQKTGQAFFLFPCTV